MTEPTSPRVWLVGEHNPYSDDPRFALYPLPSNATGGRLARVLDLDATAYLRAFERRDLLAALPWSAPRARAAADALLLEHPVGDRLVLLGARVAAAFGLHFRASLFEVRLAQVGTAMPTPTWRHVLVIPHPSGLSRAWHDPATAPRVRAAFALFRGMASES